MPNATQNGRSEPASFLQGTRDPSQDAKGMGFAPNFGQFAVPHVLTFQGLSGSFAKAYRANDEAIKHSLDNARFMRNDCTLMECLESRQRCTALLGWHLEPEDETSADQQELCAELTKILARIRRFTEYRRCLLEAIWYGKAGVQHRYGWTTIGSKRRVMPLPEARDEHPGWVPINGDKIVFRYEDGSFDPGRGTIGLLSGALGAHRDFGGPRVQWDVQPTAQGLAAFIPPSLRSIVAVHKHMIEDGAWEDPENAGSIHGVGVRSRIYWAWFQKQEALAFLMEYLERSAGGIEVWEYPAHNPEAKAKTERAARERLANGRNVVLFPRDESAAGVPYELRFVEPGMAGIETLKDLLERYFGHMVKRYILGQVLSSEAEATGLGSGVAELHFDTLMQIVRYDATNLEETLTHELVTPVKDFNFPAAKRHHVRFVIETESPDSKAKLEAWERAYNMGARLDERAVMELIGAAMPQDGDRVLQRPDMAQQPGAGPGQAGGDGASLVPGGPEQPRGRSQANVPVSLVDDAAEMGEALREVEIGGAERYAKGFDESKHPRDASGQFAATAEETAKHGEYSDLMRKHGIEPRQLEDWVTQLRAVAKRQGVKPEPSRTDAVESIELDGADVSVTFNADGAERYAKGERQFASTQVNLDDAAYSRTDGDPAGKFRAVAAEVAESDLAADGREDEPHITVLFGLHGSDPRAVAEIVREFGPVSVRFGEVTTFPPNDEHEVLKIDVESDDLRRLHDAIAALPHTDTFPDYRPHLTVAYVKPGAGAKYVGPCPLTGTEAVFDRIVFSDRDRRHVAVPLRGAGLDRHSRLSAAFDAVFRERYERVEAPPASAAETQPAKRSRGGKGGSWKKVGGSSVFVGPDGTIKKGCPGRKGENVADLKNESDESRDQRAARQAHAEAAGLKGHEVTATEARQLGGERRQRQHAEAKRTAKRFGVPVEDVLRNLPDAHALAMENWKAEEGAAKELRRRFGMNAGDAGRVENAYRDHSTIPNFDALAEEAVQEIPELSHMLQWDYRDAAAAIWDIIRGGAKRQPSPHDESVMDAAGRMAADQRRQGGKPQADDDRGDAWGPDSWDEGDTSFDPDKFSRRNAGQEAGKYERVPRFEERKHPREGDGKFAPKGGGSGGKTATAKRTDKSPAVKREKRTDKSPEQYVPTVTLSPAKGRALTGKPVRTRLSKQEIGAIGENVVVAYLQSQGLHDARPMNLDRNNFPVDLVQDHKAIEVKAGFAGNGPGARQWRLTIGEPGKAEKAWLATATPEAKAAWNRAKQNAIHARKAKVLADLEKSYGRKVAAATMTCIVNPDTKTVDIYRFDGWHNRIAWGSPEAQKAYVGSFAYQQRKGK